MSDQTPIPGEDLEPLDILDKDEFRERTRSLVPDMTDEQFDARWQDFQNRKQARSLN